jgi:histidinol-phosphate aminotransferase
MVYIPRYVGMLQPYVAGKPIDELAREKGLTRIVKLASNENPLGPSPKAIEAAREALGQNHRYCDPGAYDLTQALARKLGKPAAQIVCGAGTDSLLGYIVGAFSDFGDEVLTSHGTFIGIYVNTNKQGRRLRQVPMRDYRYDLPAIADTITERTRIVYIANPNNPTGTIVTRVEFETFMRRVPDSILVILDEAYTSYAAACPEYPDGLDYHYDNMIVTRTMSKDYGLAGFRVGYAVGPERLIGELRKIKLPFEPSLPAQKAAIAALDDDDFLKKTVELNHRNLGRLTDGFDKLELPYVKSKANFVLLTFASESQAAGFTAECMDRGLILRHVKAFGIPEGVRINSGTDDETAYALEVIEQVGPRWRQGQCSEPGLERAKG